MNKDKTLFNTFEIDYTRVENLVYEELNLFVAEYEIQPIPVVQEMRAFFIAWIAVFFPEVISKDFTEILTKRITDYRSDSDFNTKGWIRLIPLDVALFAITDNSDWLDVCITNIDHHSSVNRELVLESLSLIANKLSFHDRELLRRTENNLRNQHGLCDWGVILLVAAKGNSDEKLRLVRQWRDEFGEESWAYHIFDSILNGKSLPNTFFFGLMHERLLYVTLRLICKVSNMKTDSEQLYLGIDDNINSRGSEHFNSQDRLFPKDWASGVLDKVWDRLDSHIFFKQEINLQVLLDNEK